MRYSENFERDYAWYPKYRAIFNFDGTADTIDKIIFNKDGKSAKECFYIFDSRGRVLPTNEPQLLYDIFRCKGSINFNIKMWAESRGKGELGLIDFKYIIGEFELLSWMIEAVEKQKLKYY